MAPGGNYVEQWKSVFSSECPPKPVIEVSGETPQKGASRQDIKDEKISTSSFMRDSPAVLGKVLSGMLDGLEYDVI